MKKLYLIPLVSALILQSCKEIDPIEGLNDYKDCFSYSVDTVTGEGCVSDFASIAVKGDMTTSNFILEFKDFRLADGAAAGSATMSNLPQFMADVTNDKNEIIDVKYYFFKYQTSTRQSGSMEISDFRFGWLSTIYWLNFTSGPYKVWSTPCRYNMYATYNKVDSPYGPSMIEQAIYPKYTVSHDATHQTVTIKASGVTYPLDETDPSKSLTFRSMEWNDLPVEYTAKGYEVNVDQFSPTIDGTTDQWIIKSFKADIAADFDGTKTVTFTLQKKDGSLSVRVRSDFTYNIPRK